MSPLHPRSLPPLPGEGWGGGKRPPQRQHRQHRQQTTRSRAPIPSFPRKGKER